MVSGRRPQARLTLSLPHEVLVWIRRDPWEPCERETGNQHEPVECGSRRDRIPTAGHHADGWCDRRSGGPRRHLLCELWSLDRLPRRDTRGDRLGTSLGPDPLKEAIRVPGAGSEHICGRRTSSKRPKRFAEIIGGMVLSDDVGQSYRYSLWCRWGSGPSITWIMLNPSDAGPGPTPGCITPDDTINRIIGFSRPAFGSLRVVNLFALRDSCSTCCLLGADPVGENDAHLRAAIDDSESVAIAWGSLEKWPGSLNAMARDRQDAVLDQLSGVHCRCLARVSGGRFPAHPLRLASTLELVTWDDAPWLSSTSRGGVTHLSGGDSASRKRTRSE